jgi:hypothetical protein
MTTGHNWSRNCVAVVQSWGGTRYIILYYFTVRNGLLTCHMSYDMIYAFFGTAEETLDCLNGSAD